MQLLPFPIHSALASVSDAHHGCASGQHEIQGSALDSKPGNLGPSHTLADSECRSLGKLLISSDIFCLICKLRV